MVGADVKIEGHSPLYRFAGPTANEDPYSITLETTIDVPCSLMLSVGEPREISRQTQDSPREFSRFLVHNLDPGEDSQSEHAWGSSVGVPPRFPPFRE